MSVYRVTQKVTLVAEVHADSPDKAVEIYDGIDTGDLEIDDVHSPEVELIEV